ncbi:Beta-amyrin 16-alpha-hydroxylase CYP87D16, partial [Linum perenne]
KTTINLFLTMELLLTVPASLFISAALLLLAVAFSSINKWTATINYDRLPPGSDGFPFIGEVLHLLLPAKNFDLIPFLETRIKRTKLLGKQVVVTADSNFNHFLLQQEGVLTETWSPNTFAKLFADVNVNISSIHKYVRLSTTRYFGVIALKDKLLPEIYHVVNGSLQDWSTRSSVEIKCASADMALEYVAKLTFGYDPQQSKEKLVDLYNSITKSLFSIPFNFPGTTHHRCLKDKEKVLKMIREEYRKRQDSMLTLCSEPGGDFLDHAIRELNDGNNPNCLTEKFIINLIFGINYVSSDLVSTMTTLAVKLIGDHPLVFQELVAEHEEILKGRKGNEAAVVLSWSEYKSMNFTLQVINEILRLGNISPGIMRKAKKDIQFNGYRIPAGTVILIATAALHLNPQTYKDPLIFNPWRWNEKRASEMYKEFMPFGWGTKQCSGAEYSRLFLATFIHILVTKYTWKTVKGGELHRNPVLHFGKGLHVKFMHKLN